MWAAPVVAETSPTEAVSTWDGHRVAEDLLTQSAQEVLLREETDGRRHALESAACAVKVSPLCCCLARTFLSDKSE